MRASYNSSQIGGTVRRKKSKITIITKKKRRDGSIESQKSEIYKNYGMDFAEQQKQKLGQ
jgi:hypothetical protein